MKFSLGKASSTLKTKIYLRPRKVFDKLQQFMRVIREQIKLETDSTLLTLKYSWIL